MRWLIYFLLVLNIVVFAWFQFQQRYHKIAVAEPQVQLFDFSSVPRLEIVGLEEIKDNKNEVEQVTSVETLEEAAVDRCWLVGHYPEVISAREVRIELEGMGVYSHIVEKEIDLPPVSWVYIPSFGSREDAMPVLRKLQLNGIDSFLLTEEGEYQYAISLGFFGNKGSAEQIRAERVSQGYDAKVTERVRKKAAYWLALYDIQHSDSGIMHQKLNKTIKSRKNIKKLEISCKELALFKAKH